MIIDTLSFSGFCDGFPESYKNNFTYEGKRALFDYLEQLSEDLGENIEFDPVALCCDYSQFDDIEDYLAQYPTPTIKLEDFNTYDTPKDNIEDYHKAIREDIENHTTYIPIEGSDSFIIQSY